MSSNRLPQTSAAPQPAGLVILMRVLMICLASVGVFAATLPEPVPGWRMELVAEAPKLKHPSVVACAPDGRVFVAEDPMDISLPNAGAAEGRILCLHTNGQITVFAEKLYAVFGLQCLEGKVYVLHNPKFSVFEDDNGVGRNRRELIEQTLPDPSALNWNDHVPANFRLAMDGYFYVACGDKGLYNAQGTDGSRATLSSGGVFRIRPDGSQLEVFSHGVRNILDVALNAEDEIFTYDNTDEHDWMGRFTHMVEAGFYGYPHDFIPRRPYTLWMMEDYGPGAACGAFANNEDALPPEYQGNVFLADFGKRQVMRVRVERDGATYRAVSKEDLFPSPPGDFRPVGIALGPDGKSIYICDWNHRDEKAKVSVGRLFKLSWTGKDHSTPKPTWYLAAATGKKADYQIGELIRGLSHPSQSVRLTAQRRIADSASSKPSGVGQSLLIPEGGTPPKELIGLIENSSAPPFARSHALWALDQIDAGRAPRNEIIALCSDTNPVVRRQAIRQLGTRRVREAIRSLCERLQDQDPSVRFQAATALGRIGDSGAVPALISALEEQDLFARFAVFTALNRIGTNSPPAWPTIVGGLESESVRIREETTFALRETYNLELLRALIAFYRETARPSARHAALELIAELHHRKPEWKGQWWAYHPALQPPPAKTESWAGTATVLDTLRRGLHDTDPNLRRTCIEGLIAARDTNSAPALRAIFPNESDGATRATILRALGAMKDPGALALAIGELKSGANDESTLSAIEAAGAIGGESAIEPLSTFLSSPGAAPVAVAQAVRILAQLGSQSSISPIQALIRHPAPTVRSAVIVALRSLQGTNSLPTLESALSDPSLEVRAAAVKALADLRSNLAVPALLKAYKDEALRADALAALSRTPDERALEPLLDGLSSKNPTQRNAAHLAIRNISAMVLARIESKAETFSQQALTELRQIYAGNEKAERGPLFSRKIKQHSPEEYLEAALSLPGNAERGRALFADPTGLNCASCHKVAGQGSDLGPDLTTIGAQFDRAALAESILYPSKAVREGYQQIIIETKDDEIFSGVIKAESAEAVTLRDASAREQILPRASIKSRTNSALSLMPEGLQAALSLEEFADLISYLSSLKPK